MVETQKISIQKTTSPRIAETDFSNLAFGNVFSDHMFVADFRDGDWRDLRIIPYGPVSISPASPAIQYGSSIFEGLKAYRNDDDILIFRPEANLKRMNISAKRMAMPAIPEEVFMDGLTTLLTLDKDWIPKDEGGSFYLRPVLFSMDEFLGIHTSRNFRFMIIACPVGAYYSQPVKVKIETYYTRAMEGGTGFAKAGGNYGGAIYPSQLAKEEGYHQLIWTDGKTHQYIEEAGTMNVMFIIDGTLVTPSLSETILHGITRDSILKLARHWGVTVEERRISVAELVEGLVSGAVTEAFGVGTAATIAPIEMIGHQGHQYRLPLADKREFAGRIFLALDGIKRGTSPDLFGWVHRIEG